MQCLCVFKVSGHLGVVEHLEMEGIYAIYMKSITEYTRSVRNGSSRSNIKSIIEWPANNFEICHQRMQHDFVYSCQFQLQVQLKWNIIFTLKNNSAYVKKKYVSLTRHPMLRPKIENIPHQWPAVYILINFCVKLLCHLFKFHSKLFPSFQIKISFIILPSWNVLTCIGSNPLRITPLFGNQMCDRPHVRDVGIIMSPTTTSVMQGADKEDRPCDMQGKQPTLVLWQGSSNRRLHSWGASHQHTGRVHVYQAP